MKIIKTFSILVGALILLLPVSAMAIQFTVSGTIVTADYDEPTLNSNDTTISDLADTQVLYQIPPAASPTVCMTVPASAPTGGAHIHVDCTVPIIDGQEADVSFTAIAHDTSGNASIPSDPVVKRIDRLAPKKIE